MKVFSLFLYGLASDIFFSKDTLFLFILLLRRILNIEILI